MSAHVYLQLRGTGMPMPGPYLMQFNGELQAELCSMSDYYGVSHKINCVDVEDTTHTCRPAPNDDQVFHTCTSGGQTVVELRYTRRRGVSFTKQTSAHWKFSGCVHDAD